ncbi:hypothetical protein EV191_11293 [Tamaricihabitans halophyticus]|uniref:DUF5919 domain-containing protein n=1 Tax=Tamaricihabitans halophyticus TaxID=1262583 RepID=A0A4R2QE83_9PSEU|nr:DUF5919 domain-containing protein [Tamaricihabitans halophyticus]TCP47297.1 hypothetical protein EV191_11293 [Tamaricihabitans halophyticus]
MGNERLRGSIAAAGLTSADVAQHVGVDPKTVERWISTGRTPHRGHRWRTASLLEKNETYLWPSLAENPQVQQASQAEFVQLFPHRGAVPQAMWNTLVDDLNDSLDILVYSGLFLLDARPELTDLLIDKAKTGAQVRFLFGNPESSEVIKRSEEEGIGKAGLPGRITTALSYTSKLVGVQGIEIRLHDTILYNSIYRSDSTMLVNPHAYGSGAPFNPVMHLQRVPGGRMFDHYQTSFERVWSSAKPYEVSQ